MQDYRKLKVWQQSHALTLAVYQASKSFPKDELYGLTSQIRRSASSIPSNIAEGCGRSSRAELARFLHVALGSANELEYQLLLCHELTMLTRDEFESLSAQTNSVKRMLTSLIVSVRSANLGKLDLEPASLSGES